MFSETFVSPLLDPIEYQQKVDHKSKDRGTYIKRAVAPSILESRQRQIDICFNTNGYKNYIIFCNLTGLTFSEHYPSKYLECSKRSWDGQIILWKRFLHKFDDIRPEFLDLEHPITNESSYEFYTGMSKICK